MPRKHEGRYVRVKYSWLIGLVWCLKIMYKGMKIATYVIGMVERLTPARKVSWIFSCFIIFINGSHFSEASKQNVPKLNTTEGLRELSSKRNVQKILPEYTIIKEPPNGAADYLIMEVKLPQFVSHLSHLLFPFVLLCA